MKILKLAQSFGLICLIVFSAYGAYYVVQRTRNTEATPKTVIDLNINTTLNTNVNELPKPEDNKRTSTNPLLSPVNAETTKEKEDNSEVTAETSNSANNSNLSILKGKIICIDPGHGNPNHSIKNEPIAPSSNIMKPATAYGTVGITTNIPEYKLTMLVSLKLRDELLKAGAKVLMTRESNDTDLGNIERAEIANKESADISIRIHADGIDDSSVTGISVLTPGNQYIKDNELLLSSGIAAKLVLENLINRTQAQSRGVVVRNDLTGFNWSKVPVILIEMGFMTNPSEDDSLNTDDYQNKIVGGIVDGVTAYLCH